MLFFGAQRPRGMAQPGETGAGVLLLCPSVCGRNLDTGGVIGEFLFLQTWEEFGYLTVVGHLYV